MPITEAQAGSGWFDSHCHLDDFSDPATAWQEARSAGIHFCMIPGTHPEQWIRARAQCVEDQMTAQGIHPWFVSDPERDIDALERLLQSGDVNVIGEIGLDFYRGASPRPDPECQMRCFQGQLKLASEYSKPIILHAVKAHQEIIRALKDAKVLSGVVHAFVGPPELAQQYLDLGLYIGIGPQLFRSPKLQRAVRSMPLERILLETDAPYMATENHSDNPMLDLIAVAEKIAELKAVSLTDLRRQTCLNTNTCFALAS